MKHAATEQRHATPINPAPIVVIGYGNPLRRDDGAGRVLAEKLVAAWAQRGIAASLITDMQLLPEMTAQVASQATETLILIDTTVDAPDAEIQIRRLQLDTSSPSFGHQLDPVTLLLYMVLLYQRNPRAWLVTIPGVDFDHGQGFSPQVELLLNDVTPFAARLLTMISVEERSEEASCTN